ncbi:ATP-binding protein [Thermodesulfobacteriota bacterium]
MQVRDLAGLSDRERRKLQEGRLRNLLLQYYAPREPMLMGGIFNFLQVEKKLPLHLIHKVIDRLANITIATTVMTYMEVVEFIKALPDDYVIAKGPCACRVHTAELGPDARELDADNLGLCRQSPLDVDIQIAASGEAFAKLEPYTTITREELLELEERCHNMGLVANVYTMFNGESGLCHCSSKTCIPFIANEAIDQKSAVIRAGRSIAQTDSSRCEAHGDCLRVCHFNARRITEHQDRRVSVLVDSARCYGCGYCAEVCPQEAITMVERGG